MLDFVSDHCEVTRAREARGRCNHLAGDAAEAAVLAQCLALGWTCLARRWRGGCGKVGGEIDLIFRDGAQYVFVEVKKSDSFDAALACITPRQVARIYAAAEVYLSETPEGTLADVRFDAALVNGFGEVQIMEGALLPY